MAKKVVKLVKLQIPAGKATPAPPVGPALGQAQVNIMGFCKELGSGEPNKKKVATVTRDQVREIAELKAPDLNAADVEAAMRMVEGTARSMGFVVEG